MNDKINIIHTQINETELFIKYKSSYISAFIDLSIHAVLMSLSFYSLWFFRNSLLSIFTIPLFSLFIIRTFVVFHDCGHNSYTPNKTLNYLISNLLGILVFTPLCWSWHHKNHHLTSGNKTNYMKHKYNETVPDSLQDYKQYNRLTQISYKIIRYPFIFFIIYPILYYGLQQRIDVLRYRLFNKYPFTQSTIHIIFELILSNISILGFVYYLYKYEIILHYIIVMIIFGFITFSFFHNQHTYNPSYVIEDEKWSQRDSGILGSSFIQVPYFLKYFFMGIEYHHIHHINSKIPGYNLQKYHEKVVSKSNMFDNVVKISMKDYYNNLWLVLYDEDKKKYITFKQADEEIRNNKDN